MSRSVVADAVGDVVDAVDEAVDESVDVSLKAASHWRTSDADADLDVRAAEAMDLSWSSHPQTGAEENRCWMGPPQSPQSNLELVAPDSTDC